MADLDDFPDLDPEALANAEAALSDLSRDYLTWAEADIASLRACLTELEDHPAIATLHLDHLFRIAHDMKGQATTFGYPLVTEIAHRLSRLIETGITDPAPLRRHVEALAEVIESRLSDDGGKAGAQVLERLE